ncbi:related to nuclear migration protein ami1 [Rhynchosporium agropyri]|uniref:Related to nuclear migration protein ami1 n=1 Tax=Rhynchosporium agropyri TaxID=914238 RepID=A0A1E1KUM7_9HELO|nr:related to nuclear migration protein ami1 [Rhynchosporium agropyri]
MSASNMTAWETEDEYCLAAQQNSLPTPTDTPYRTPSRVSRRSSRQNSVSPGPSSSPPPMPTSERNRRQSTDVTNDESISILDPRRFTPTLHANLVSEILALRRDQEEKVRTIENLEADLHNSRGDHEDLDANLVSITKENRSLKRQLALLEGGTSSALSELGKERDEAVENNLESKKRIETLQKKVRSQEDDSDRAHELWQKDKDNWEEERRKLERKVHIAETRLKTVLDEVATYQAQANGHLQNENEADETLRDPVHGHGSDAASVRTMSMTNSVRFSLLNGPNGYGGSKLNGVSLADELDLDEDEDETDHDGRESVISVRHNRTQSRESVMSRNHRRNQSMDSLMRPGSVARGRVLAQQAVLERLEDGIIEDDETLPAIVEYTDTGVQYSPPPSPVLTAAEMKPSVEPMAVNLEATKDEQQTKPPVPREWEIEANQRRKRTNANPPLIIESPSASMVSEASQTLEEPLSPPRTPITPTRAPPLPPVDAVVQKMISVFTQTDVFEVQALLPSPRRTPPPPPIPIPSIQLHPPNSAPATPHEPLLPQHLKDAGCQVSMQVAIPTRSISVQTEEIRVAQRLNLLPAHLHPSAISSLPPSPEATEEKSKRFSPVPGNLPPRNPLRVTSRTNLEQEIPSSPPQSTNETRDAYPGSNDDGPLSKDRSSIRRPHRISSLFAGFDNLSSDDAEDFADADMSDNDYRTALSAPNPHPHGHRPSKRVSTPPTSVPEDDELAEFARPFYGRNSTHAANEVHSESFPEVQELPSRSTKASVRQLDKPLTLVTNSKPTTMRRAALIQSGVAAHQGRSRSPSLPEVFKEPPFPIPTRASSRRPHISASAPSDGNRSPTWGRGSGSRRGGHHRSNSIRKVRSAAALPRGGRGSYRRQGSRSPPPMSPSTEAPESPRLPPMPNNEVTTPRYMRDTSSNRHRSHQRQQPSTTTANTTNTTNTGSGSFGTTNNATSVVDAIAQTMVGEWMFKYVRRHKSFGPAESGMDGDNGNGVRHKRWVWLAPYERAVMWSSKQPTSGSALMGKAGRKLTIQSVLDVKDDNAPPKGSPLFNRSILILTPARALKFTATSSERHYIWLTALSFLAHSSQAVPEIVQAPLPLPQPSIPDFEIPRQSGGRLRKQGIRDSIRVAKGKTTLARPGPTSVHSSNYDQSSRESESMYSKSDPLQDLSADPPVVPRFSERGQYSVPPLPTHARKRSNTGGRVPPPLSFRGFSGPSSSGHAPTSSTAGTSVVTTSSSDAYQSQPSSSVAGGYTGMSASGRSSIRTSDASNRPGTVVNNFFDAVGTMRMEAFISPMAMSRFDDFPDEQDEMGIVEQQRRHSGERKRRSRNRDSYYANKGRTSDDWYGGSKTAGEEDYGRFNGGLGNDPFRGF